MKLYRFALVFVVLFISACGSVNSTSVGQPDPTANPELNNVYLFATDFASSGQVYHSNSSFDFFSNTGLANLGSGAIIRFFNDMLFILHDGFSAVSFDNVQVVDPSNGFATLNQFSTGIGTNPQDIIVSDNLAFISLYSPANSPQTVDGEGNPADVIIMNLEDGSTVKGLSFVDHLNDDGAKTARAAQMVRVGNKIYVCLQDLDGDFLTHNTSGKIGVINMDSMSIEDVYVLKGHNPVDIVYSSESNALFVALQAPYDFALGGFDLSTEFGGIEIVPVDGSESTLIADNDLGGYIERLATDSKDVFAVASEFDPVTFEFFSAIKKIPANTTDSSQISTFIEKSLDVREIGFDAKDQLWISRRAITAGEGEASSPQVDVFSVETGQTVATPMVPVVPVTSIAFDN